MNNLETCWYNKNIFSYNGVNPPVNLSVLLTTNTQDFQSFSPMTLDLCISPKGSKSKMYKLDFFSSYDLLQTIIRVKNSGNPFENKSIFSKRYNKNKNLEFKYGLDANNEKVITIIIRCGELDFNDITIPSSVFNSFCNLVKDFNVNYIKISNDISNNFLQIESLKELKMNNNLLKTLPSKLIEINYDQYVNNKLENNEPSNSNNSKEISQLDSNSLLSSKNLEDFDKFIGGNEVKNIEISEVTQLSKEIPKENTPKEINVNFDSDFINKVLNQNITNFENLMISIYQDTDPLQDLLSKLKDKMNLPPDFHFLSDIDQDDFKSIKYLSNVLLKTNLKNYLIKNIDFPNTSPIIKFKSSCHLSQSIKLAYDLLLIVVYVKMVNSKLSTKIHDIHDNKKILYIVSRLILDPLIFSFLTNNIEDIKNEVMLRFKSYEEKGFFKDYEDILDENNLEKIEYNKFEEILEKIINVNKKSQYIQKLHNNNFAAGKLKLPSKNSLNVEQITNEVIELEVACNLNPEKKLKEIVKNIGIDISEEIIKIFEESNKPKRHTINHGTNLLRYMNFNKSDISEKYKDDILKYVTSLNLNNFDYDKFPLEELNESIVKGIYIWNESDNKEEKYTKFFSECENALNKDMIISKVRTVANVPIEDDIPWFTD